MNKQLQQNSMSKNNEILSKEVAAEVVDQLMSIKELVNDMESHWHEAEKETPDTPNNQILKAYYVGRAISYYCIAAILEILIKAYKDENMDKSDEQTSD